MSLPSVRLIVLRKIKYQESDLIIQGISSTGMKVSFLAKGALRSRRRFSGGVLDPFHYIEVGLGRSAGTSPTAYENSTLRTILEARLLRGFDSLNLDYDRLQLGFYFLELVHKVTQVGEGHNETLFQLLGHSLMALEKAVDLQILKVHFALKFLLQQGVLEIEPWMKPFLKNSLAENKELFLQKDQILFYNNSEKLELTIKNYLLTAQVE